MHLINLIRAFCLFVKASFDVYREDKRRYCWGVVEDVDFSEQAKRIYFRFKKSKDNHVEWIDFGSPRIFIHKSKTAKKPKMQRKEHDGATLESAATEAPNGNDSRSNMNPMKPPPSNNGDHDHEMDPNGNGISLNMRHISQSYEPCSNDTNSVAHLLVSAHRLPDFISPPDVTSFTVVNHRLNPELQQHELDNHGNRMQHELEATTSRTTEVVLSQQSAAPETSISTLHRSGGSIPAGWSALDMLAAVTFDAATSTTTTSTTSMDPTSSTFAESSNSASSTAGPVQASYGWGGGSSNGNNSDNNTRLANQNYGNMYSNGNHHEPTYPNQQQYMPMWPQQQTHSEQQWYPSMNTIRMTQQQQLPILPTVTMNSYDRMNHNILSQQQQQQWHNTSISFNGDNRNMNSNNSNNIDDHKQPAANQYFTRHE